jgi:hypothetical protein
MKGNPLVVTRARARLPATLTIQIRMGFPWSLAEKTMRRPSGIQVAAWGASPSRGSIVGWPAPVR